MIIAIDGPAGSGKSSTARAVADRLGFRHLDSGAFYRALTWAAMHANIPGERWDALRADELAAFDVQVEPAGAEASAVRMRVAGRDVTDDIRGPDVTARVPAMARVPAVRDWLLDRLRDVAADGSVVADGRDIGTVVFPDADLKVFLVAEVRTRAQRRLLQSGLADDEDAIDAEVRRIEQRDRTDSSREVAPLRAAEDAVRLDTTGLDFAEQVERIVELARARGAV